MSARGPRDLTDEALWMGQNTVGRKRFLCTSRYKDHAFPNVPTYADFEYHRRPIPTDTRKIHTVSDLNVIQVIVRAYLEVARNLPFGENCRCRTSATCASNDCVGCKLFNFGTSVPTREFFSTPTGSASFPFPSDDIVLWRRGLRPSTGNAVDAARILMTARTAFANRPRPAPGSDPT